jgi:hypothetical protein
MAPKQDNSTLAILLEAIPGFFGLFGIGWMVAGYVVPGILLLVGGIIAGVGIWIAGTLGAIVTGGATLLCPAIFNIAVLIISSLVLNSKLKQRRMGIVR